MKIYPSKHQILNKKRPGFFDIPSSHIEKEYIPEKIIINRKAGFNQNSSKEIVPYDNFDNDDFLIFNDNKEMVNSPLEFKNNEYIYMPQQYTEFVPTDFSVSLTLKKRYSYQSSNNYNISVGVLYSAGKDSEAIAKNLMTIFGDAHKKQIAPSNVTINNGSKVINQLLTNNIDRDITIIPINSLTRTRNNQALNINTALSKYGSVWLTVDTDSTNTFFDTMDSSGITAIELISHSNLYKGLTNFDSSTCGLFADLNDNRILSMFPRSDYEYIHESIVTSINDKTPIYILHKPDNGYVIISSEKIFSNLSIYKNFIYNVLSYVAFNNYIDSSSRTYWITDDPVDYIKSIGNSYRRNHSIINIYDIIEDTELSGGYDIVSVDINRNDVIFDRIGSNNELFFKKVTPTDPVRNQGEISIYTINRSVIRYIPESLYVLEESPTINTTITDDNKCYVEILPFVSSKNNIVLKEKKRFELKKLDKEYSIVVLPISPRGESEVILYESDRYYGDLHRIAEISIEFSGKIVAYDIRLLGGGLPLSLENNYELLDIGNIKGRPYRVGTGAVIRLPKIYKEYEDQIKTAVAQYKVAADRFYLVFE